MGSGTALAKCAMWEGEDMSAKSDVSDVYLSITVRQPVSGVCSHAGTQVNSTVDNSWDIRHIASTSASLSGNCLEVNLHRGHVTGLGSTVNVFCYSAGEQDYAN